MRFTELTGTLLICLGKKIGMLDFVITDARSIKIIICNNAAIPTALLKIGSFHHDLTKGIRVILVTFSGSARSLYP